MIHSFVDPVPFVGCYQTYVGVVFSPLLLLMP
jgi:hypothetical protein